MRRFSSMNLQLCPGITWGKGWSQDGPSCWGFMEIRPLLGIIPNIQSSITKDITTTAGVWTRSIYTQQQPE